MSALAQRAVACPAWRWLPGMREAGDWQAERRMLLDPSGRVGHPRDYWGGVYDYPEAQDDYVPLPDLSDAPHIDVYPIEDGPDLASAIVQVITACDPNATVLLVLA